MFLGSTFRKNLSTKIANRKKFSSRFGETKISLLYFSPVIAKASIPPSRKQ
jgi:hypothetical protein